MKLLSVKTVTVTEKGQIVVPKEIRDVEGFAEGSKIALLAFDDHVELRSLRQLDLSKPGIQTALLSEKVLAKTWLTSEEDEAWKTL
jgi:AbrB family looped-hinge helix DNA binding protein